MNLILQFVFYYFIVNQKCPTSTARKIVNRHGIPNHMFLSESRGMA